MKAVAHRLGVRRPTCVTPCHFQASHRDEGDVAPLFRGPPAPGYVRPSLRDALVPETCWPPNDALAHCRHLRTTRCVVSGARRALGK